MVAAHRAAEYEQVRRAVTSWARAQSDIEAAAIVGSWARGTAGMASDVDIVVLTTDKARYAAGDQWIGAAVGQEALLVRTKEWGVLIERRIRLASGLEVEFGFVDPSWANVHPVDPGTAGVVLAGCQPLLDRHGSLELLVATVTEATAPWSP